MKHYAMVGMQHRGEPKGWAVQLVESLPKDEDVELVREPDNKFDRFAIQVWVRGVHVAFIAAAQNRDLATFMDARHRRFPLGAELGARLQAKFYRSSGGAPLVAVLEMQ